jgi:hypothetical protein
MTRWLVNDELEMNVEDSGHGLPWSAYLQFI